MDGTTTITSGDVIEAVRDSALLADVSVSIWRAEKTDKMVTNKVKSDAGASGNVGRFTKNILAGADGELKQVQSAYNQIRSIHYGMTLPWVSDPHATRQSGARLLPNLLFDEYIKKMQAQRRQAEEKLEEFVGNLPGHIQTARANLAALADADYPDEGEVRRAFRIHVDFEPLPASAQFKGLPEFTVERLGKALEKRQRKMLHEAQAHMWNEVKNRVGHLAERLSDPENTFHASTIENTRELLSLLPGWSFGTSAEASEVVQDIKRMLDGVEAKEIRTNPVLRTDVADKADRLLKKLAAFGV